MFLRYYFSSYNLNYNSAVEHCIDIILFILVIRLNVGILKATFIEFHFRKLRLHLFQRDALEWTLHKLLFPPIKFTKLRFREINASSVFLTSA